MRLLPDLTADSAGVVDSGELDVAAGAIVRFTWHDEDSGRNGFCEQVLE